MAGQIPTSNQHHHNKPLPPPPRCQTGLNRRTAPPKPPIKSHISLQKYKSLSALPPKNCPLPPHKTKSHHILIINTNENENPNGKDSDVYRKSRCHIRCICGRRMEYSQNPQNKYPPNAVLYCQQSTRCKKKMIIQIDWFYCCKSRTSYHGTKDGTFKICYSCSLNQIAKQERIRQNHQLLIKQLKNKDNGKVLITNDTKEYILSSTASNSKDQTLKLLKETYDITSRSDTYDIAIRRYKVIKEGFMLKKGAFWNKAFKKRYFKLFENKQLFYYKHFENGMASDERGIADLAVINDMIKKGKNGFEISTPSREWKFLCNNSIERDEWWKIMYSFWNKPPDLHKARTVPSGTI